MRLLNDSTPALHHAARRRGGRVAARGARAAVASCVPLPKLERPLPTIDGGTLRTIQEGCEYMAAISKEREQRWHWQQVRELIDQKADVDAVSWKLWLAILKDAKLDLTALSESQRKPRDEPGLPRS